MNKFERRKANDAVEAAMEKLCKASDWTPELIQFTDEEDEPYRVVIHLRYANHKELKL